jgi:hypothetical protein
MWTSQQQESTMKKNTLVTEPSDGADGLPRKRKGFSDGYFKYLNVSAKIDYVTFRTEGLCKLPPLEGKSKWGVSAHYKTLSVHDVSPGDISKLIEIVGDLELLEVEVAVDFSPLKRIREDQAERMLNAVMTHLFGAQLHPKRGGPLINNFRAVYDFSAPKKTRPFNFKLPSPTDQQLHGARNDPIQVKAYKKIKDQGVDLAKEECSARVEVRMSGEVLRHFGLNCLSDLTSFKFRRQLTPYLRFVSGVRTRQIHRKSCNLMDLHAAVRAERAMDKWEQAGVGAILDGNCEPPKHLRLLRNMVANDKVGQALTRLEQRFAKNSCVLGGDSPRDDQS